MTIKTFRGV